MSRWQQEFENHSFQSAWKALLAESGALRVDDQTVLTSVQELARFCKVIAFLQKAIESLDAELIPRNVWDNFDSQCRACLQEVHNYKSSFSIQYLQNGNSYLDNLLTYVKPYLIPSEALAEVLSTAALTYKASLEDGIKVFLDTSDKALAEIKGHQKNAKNLLEQINKGNERISDLIIELIDGDEKRVSIKNVVDDAKRQIQDQSNAINEMHQKLLVDKPETEESSIKTKIENAWNFIDRTQKYSFESLNILKEKMADLSKFHTKIFGEACDGEVKSGLDYEITMQILRLAETEKRIDGLLSGATSIGLARAYEAQRRSFASPIKSNSRAFFISVSLLPAIALATSIGSISFEPFAVTMVNPQSQDEILKFLIFKLPFMAPLVWLAIFSSTRRSQYERLQQEYAHKASLAKSYESYKKQIQTLVQIDSEPLQKELISKAIEAIAYNASQTLDGKHREKTPVEHALSFLESEKGASLIDRLRQYFASDKAK